MLRLKVNDVDYRVSFVHKNLDEYETECYIGRGVDEPRRATVATISSGDTILSKGVSICHPGDIFRRATGRKIALADALSKLNKPLRKEIWTAYKSRCKF